MQKLYIKDMPQLPYAMEEAINRLRVNISFLGKTIKKIMIISSMPNEGKSLVSMHLWRQMAESGTKSVFLDLDMRKSMIADQYNIEIVSAEAPDEKSENEKGEKKDRFGTSNYLSGDGPLDEALYRTQYPSGDMIPNFDNIVNPSLLLESDRLKGMLNQLADRYRYVFIDAPPLNLVSDGERMGHLCDGAILIVHAGETSRSLVKNSIGQLERAGCPLLGVVLNRVEGVKGGYYSKRYGRYYYGKKGAYYSNKK